MYESILEYIVNAHHFYRLWMVGEHMSPQPRMPSLGSDATSNVSQPRTEWLPELVGTFDDPRTIPEVVRVSFNDHQLDGEFRFHSGSSKPTIKVETLEFFWGCTVQDVFNSERSGRPEYQKPWRSMGPCHVTLKNLQMWHHQDLRHRRRGDAVICEQATFKWNTKKDSEGAYRESGPFQIVLRGFHAAYNMGECTKANYAHMALSWGTENGIRLGDERVMQVINKHRIGINPLLTDCAFEDPGEEFIFWDEIGRQQQDAA